MIIRELVTRIGFQFDKTGFDRAASNIEELKHRVLGLAQAFSLPVFAEGLKHLVYGAVELGSRLNDTAEAFGITTEALQRFQYVAGLSGIKAAQFNAAMGPLSRQIFAAGEGSKEAAALFHKFGISFKDTHGNLLPTEEVIGNIAERISKMTDPAEQAGLAMKFFGRSGARLVPILKQGREGLRKAGLGLERLGGPVSKEAIEALDALGDRTDESHTAFERLKVSIAMGVVPVFTKMATALGSAYGSLSKLVERTHIAQAAILGLGTVLTFFALRAAIAFLPVLLPLTLTAAGIAVLTLAYEDLWVSLKGGDSLLNRFVKWCHTAKDSADGLAGAIARIGDYLFNLTAPLERLMDMADRAPTLETKARIAPGGQIDETPRINGQAVEKRVRKAPFGLGPDVTYYVPAPVDPATGVPNALDASNTNDVQQNGSPLLTPKEFRNRYDIDLDRRLDRGRYGEDAKPLLSSPGPLLTTSEQAAPQGGGGSVDNSQIHVEAPITITQLPGEDGEALAARMRQQFDTTLRKVVKDARAATLPRVKVQ